MLIATIAKNELQGSVEYEDSSPAKIIVSFPDEDICRNIITYSTRLTAGSALSIQAILNVSKSNI